MDNTGNNTQPESALANLIKIAQADGSSLNEACDKVAKLVGELARGRAYTGKYILKMATGSAQIPDDLGPYIVQGLTKTLKPKGPKKPRFRTEVQLKDQSEWDLINEFLGPEDKRRALLKAANDQRDEYQDMEQAILKAFDRGGLNG